MAILSTHQAWLQVRQQEGEAATTHPLRAHYDCRSKTLRAREMERNVFYIMAQPSVAVFFLSGMLELQSTTRKKSLDAAQRIRC